MKNRNLILIVLDFRKSKIKALADSVSGKAFFLHPHYRRAEGPTWFLQALLQGL
jgi:hypothetical protein